MAQNRPTVRRNTTTRQEAATRTSATGSARTTQKTATRSFMPKGSNELLFGRTNFMLMLVGLALIAVGLIMMAGGKQAPDQWNVDEIYSVRRISLAPVLILAGLVVEIVAIFKGSNTSVDPIAANDTTVTEA